MAQISLRMDEELKESVERFADDLGMKISTVVLQYMTKCVNNNKLPFTNRELLQIKSIYDNKSGDEVCVKTISMRCKDESLKEDFIRLCSQNNVKLSGAIKLFCHKCKVDREWVMEYLDICD